MSGFFFPAAGFRRRKTRIIYFLLIVWSCMCGNEMSMPVVAPRINHTASVIFLHGLGDTGHGWCDALKEISAPYVKYICPTASTIRVTLNGGMPMPAWFDISSLSFNGPTDEAGIKKSVALVTDLIDKEIEAGIPSERIVLGGFSQGGAIAAYTTLSTTKKLGGAVILSSFLPLHETLSPDNVNKDTPIFQAHGDADNVVAFKFGKMTHEAMKQFNSKSTFKVYPNLQHGSSDEEMRDVKNFLAKVLPMKDLL